MYKVQEGKFALLQKATSCLTEVHVSLVCNCAKMQKTFEAFEAPQPTVLSLPTASLGSAAWRRKPKYNYHE